MFTVLFNLLDPSTFTGQTLQGLLQVIIWIQIFKVIKSFMKRNYSKSSWYLQACTKGDGEAEFLMLIIAIPQHTISATFAILGYYFNSLQLFSMGSLGEFAFEFIELYNLFMSIYVYKNCPFKPDMVQSLIFHHLPGVLVIIPTNVYFGDNPYVQRITFSLLFVAPLMATFFMLYKTRDVYNLQQRGQFTVYMFCGIAIMVWARFYWTPSIMIEFLFDGFMQLSLIMKIMFLFYGILITVFNCTFIIILGQRLYEFLYCDKCIVKKLDKKEFTEKLKQPGTAPMMIRSKSNPLHFADNYSKKRN